MGIYMLEISHFKIVKKNDDLNCCK